MFPDESDKPIFIAYSFNDLNFLRLFKAIFLKSSVLNCKNLINSYEVPYILAIAN